MTWLHAMLGLPSETRLLVGVSDHKDADGSWRIYLNARYTGLHTHTTSDADAEKCRGSIGGHTFIDVPDDLLCNCPEDAEVSA